MNEANSKDRERASGHAEECYCPFCTFARTAKRTRTRHSDFFDHLYNAQIELLKAFRSVVDGRIEYIEKKKAAGEQKEKVTKVVVD